MSENTVVLRDEEINMAYQGMSDAIRFYENKLENDVIDVDDGEDVYIHELLARYRHIQKLLLEPFKDEKGAENG